MNSIPRRPVNLPSNLEAEQSLLGTLLVQNSAFDKVSDFLRPEHFHFPVHARIYAAISELLGSGKSCSAVILKQAFADDPDLEEIGGVGYFADLMGGVVTLFNVEEYGRAIFDLYQRRHVIEICDDVMNRASTIAPEEGAADIITGLETSLYAITETVGIDEPIKEFSTSIASAIDAAQAAYRGDPRARGITTGLIDLDDKIGGLKAPDLIILAARPGMGKTAAAAGIAWAAARTGKPVAFFSLEMSSEQIATRILASHAGVSSDIIRQGKVSEAEFRQFVTSSQALASLPFLIDDRPGRTIAQIRSAVRRLKRRKGLGLIVVDYLQLIRPDGRSKTDGRVNELTQITGGLKGLAKEFDVPVLALSQLNRGVENREDKRPMLSDLRESGSIEQDADIVAFIYREEYYVDNDKPAMRKDETQASLTDRYMLWQDRLEACRGKAEIIVAKQRHGRTGTVEVHWDGPTTTFSNLARQPGYDPSRDR